MKTTRRLAFTIALLAIQLGAAARADAKALRFLAAYGVGSYLGSEPGSVGLALAPDGKHLYIANEGGRAVVTAARDEATGRLTLVGQIHTPTPPGSVVVYQPHALAISPDGANVYAACLTGDALYVFARNAASGALTLVQEVHDGHPPVNGLEGAQSVVVSPDGAHVYIAAATANAVTTFLRDPATGSVTFVNAKRDDRDGFYGLGGAKGLAISPDGAYLYVAASVDNAVTVLHRDPTSGELSVVEMQQDGPANGDGLEGARFVKVTPDGAHVLVASDVDDTITVFGRNAGNGRLTFVEVHRDEVNGENGLNGADGIAVSGDGTRVYITGEVDDSLVVFSRDPGTGVLTFVEREDDRDDDPNTIYLDSPRGVVVSADGGSVYATGFVDDAVAAFRVPLCGDGVVDEGELCDDGNTLDDDCCSAACETRVGTACTDDGNGCTDDLCNEAGACAHTPNTIPCDDGAFCTVGDTCTAGACRGTARDCSFIPLEQCEEPTCDENADVCVARAKADGVACEDGNRCTPNDTCRAGACISGNPLVCIAPNTCYEAGVCQPATGQCWQVAKPDGSSCNDGDPATDGDRCTAGACRGTAIVDVDRDGVSDVIDLCPAFPDPAQIDADADGVGDACQCNAPAPGHCLPGGGPAASDCLLEFNPSSPVTLNLRRSKPKPGLTCTDGDPACDRDRTANGRCAFGIALCLGNRDPRLAKCGASDVVGFDILGPRATSDLDRANLSGLQGAVAAMGVGSGQVGSGACSRLTTVVVPTGPGGRPSRLKLRTRARAADGRTDVDRLTLECRN